MTPIFSTGNRDGRVPDSGRPAAILIIGAEAGHVALMTELTSTQSNWQIQSASSLTGALDYLARQPWDLLLLDLQLPDSRGLEAFFKLREEAPESGIVVLSAESEESLIQETLRGGSQDFVIKGSLSPALILQVVKNALERTWLGLEANSSRQLLASTLDTLPNYIAIMDEDGRIRATNLRWTSYANKGNPFIYGCQEGSNYLATCDQARGGEGNISSVAAGILQVMIGTLDRFSEDYTVPAFTGNSWYELNATRFTEKSGAQTIVISHTDISDRKELESKLRVSEELFTIITHNVVDLMAIVDPQGRHLFTTPSYQSVLGYSKQELDQLNQFALIHPEDVEKVASALHALFTGDPPKEADYRMKKKSGEYLHFEARGSCISRDATEAPRALIVARDVTARRLAEQEKALMEVQLRQAQKLEAIGQLAAGIAHEINTPIQYIGDNVIFLRDAIQDLCHIVDLVKEASGPQMQDELQRIDMDYLREEMPRAIHQSLEGISRVSKIVSAMKNFSHPSSEKKEFIHLNKAIEHTAIISTNEWKYFAALELCLDPDLPLVPCFPGELNQVLLNLIVNAAHAIEEKKAATKKEGLGKIRISTLARNRRIEIRVSDDGNGIPDAIRNRIFDLFFTTKPVGKGTGQGLALAHGVIAEKHKGQIYFESEVGQGTTFIIELPLDDEGEPDRQ